MRDRQAQVFLLSAAVISHQLALMRALSVARSYHFAYLVIGVALLGFGASGVFLRFTLSAIARRPASWRVALYALAIAFLPVGYMTAMALPLDLQYLLHGGGQVPLLFLCVVSLLVPFFLLAVLIGLEIAEAGAKVSGVYAASLWGSGVGGVGGLGLAMLVPPLRLPLASEAIALAAFVAWGISSRRGLGRTRPSARFAVIAAAIAWTVVAILALPDPRIDQYKALSNLQQLATQGDAQRIATRFSARPQVDVYRSPRLHQTLFAGIQTEELPPPELALLLDGELAGVSFQIDRIQSAAILDSTPQSLPYRMVDAPRVLLLGEVGGTNIWLAKRFGAASITVVQGHPGLVNLVEGDLAKLTGGIFRAPDVTVIREDPRSYLEHAQGTFDLIHLASPEGMPAGSSGLYSLNEDWLLTVEGMSNCLRLLSERGLVAVTRGIQEPPRDNVRLFALFAEALKANGAIDPSRQLLQGRNYLAVTTMMSRSPLGPESTRRFVESIRSLGMDAEYYPGINSEAIRQVNIIPGPPGLPWSWYHEAARQILSGRARELYRGWAYRVDPPTDDSPYFHDFFAWRSLGAFMQAYGGAWLRKLELGYVVVVVTAAATIGLALLLLVPPLVVLSRRSRSQRNSENVSLTSANRLPALLHFTCIGAAFMLIEMVLIQKLTRLLGDPIVSASAVLTAILVFSGFGSAVLSRLAASGVGAGPHRIRLAAGIILVVGLGYLALLDPLVSRASGLVPWARYLLAVLLLLPLSFPMGWLFPLGMRLLDGTNRSFVPVAWGVNGFASVSASPIAVLLSMSFGFRVALAAALALYAAAGAASWLWKSPSAADGALEFAGRQG